MKTKKENTHTKAQLLKYRKQIMKERKEKKTEEWSPRSKLQHGVIHKIIDYEC